MKILNAPGLHGSGPIHWQTRWEQIPGRQIARTTPASWDEPDPADWLTALRGDILASGSETIVVAHSLACIVMAQILADEALCAGLVLVAPPDPHAEPFRVVTDAGFHTMATRPVLVPGLVIASTDDPYATPEATQRMADVWGVPLTWVGALGHINSASGLGDWPQGWAMVEEFAATLGV